MAWLGGGQLFSHGCHYIDILLWFLGRPIRGTHLGTNTGTPWMEREGTSHVTIEFAGGALGYHFGTWGARGTKLGYSFQAHCTDGMLEIDFTNGQLLAHTQLRGEESVETRTEVLLDATSDLKPGATGTVRTELGRLARIGELSHFLDCVETGGRPLTDGPGSLQGLRLIWRLYAAEEHSVVADLRGLGLDEYRD